MFNIESRVVVSMLIGGIVAGGSAIMYAIGKLVFDPRVQCLKNASEIRDTSHSGFGYLQGPLHTDTPINYDDKHYIRLDESIYHITSTRVDKVTPHNNAHSKFEKKAEFVHRTAKQTKPIFVNNVDIGVFVKSLPLKMVGTEFIPIGDYISKQTGCAVNVNINNLQSDTDHILEEHDRQVIGIEHRRSGIKAGKVYTIFGYFDAEKQKMRKSDKKYNIVTKQSRDDLVEHEQSFAHGWKYMWAAGMFFGSVVSAAGFIFNKTYK